VLDQRLVSNIRACFGRIWPYETRLKLILDGPVARR
jgi:hypothetical protein